MSATETVKKIFEVVSTLERLSKDLERVENLLRDHHERIVRLESNTDLIAEKSKNAALQAVMASTETLRDQVSTMKYDYLVAQMGPTRKVRNSKPDGGSEPLLDADPMPKYSRPDSPAGEKN
jgi:hypothetical protein